MYSNSTLGFLARLAVDIRTERCLRFSLICAVCFSIYFYWDIQGKCLEYRGGQCLYFVTYNSRTYWTMLRFMAGQLSMFPHHHMGWTFALLGIIFLALTLVGVILMAIVAALKYSVWAGYLTVCGSFTIVFGPLFCANNSVPANAVGLIGGLILDFLYIPLVEPMQTAAANFVKNDLIWNILIKLTAINFAMFLAISIGAYLIPPFRSARVGLHAKAYIAISALADGYAHLAQHLLDGSSKYETMQAPEIVDRALLLKGFGAGSIQDLSGQALLEPSLLHPATLSAMPGDWNALVTSLLGSEYQLHMLYRCLQVAQPSGAARHLTGASTLAVSQLLRVIAESVRLERRGKHDLPPLDFSPMLVGRPAAREAKTRQQLQEELEAALEAGRESMKQLGKHLLSSNADSTTTAGGGPDSSAKPPASDLMSSRGKAGAFLLMCKAFTPSSNPSAAVEVLLEGDVPKGKEGDGPKGKEPLLKRLKAKLGKKPKGLPHVEAGDSDKGLSYLTAALLKLQEKLSTMSIKNVVIQLLVTGGGVTLVACIVTWLKCAAAIIKTPFTLVAGRRGDLWRQPVNIYFFIQFVAGIFAMFALATYSSSYRNWQDADSHGATWPLLAFLLVLNPTTEATIQKGILRIIGTILGALLAWGFLSVSLSGAWLIPMSVLALAPGFWLLEPPSHSSFPLPWWQPLSYSATAYTFGYIMVMSYGGYSFSIYAAVTSRMATQAMGALIAIFLSTFCFPVSGAALSTCYAEEAMVDLDSAVCMLQGIVAPPRSSKEAAAHAQQHQAEGLAPPRSSKEGAHAQQQQEEEEGLTPVVSDATWEAVQRELDRAETALADMLPMHDSLVKHSFQAVIGGHLRGCDHHAQLAHASRALPMTHKLIVAIASAVKRLVERPLEAGSSSSSGVKMDGAEAAEWQRSAQTATAAQLAVLSSRLRTAQRQLHASFQARRRIIPLPYMPVPWPALQDEAEEGGVDAEEGGGDPEAGGHGAGRGHGDADVSSMEGSGMAEAIDHILASAVGGKDAESALARELDALVEGQEGALADAVGRSQLGILLYVAEQIVAAQHVS